VTFHVPLDAIDACIAALCPPAPPNPSAVPVTCVEIHQDLPGAGQRGHPQLLRDVARGEHALGHIERVPGRQCQPGEGSPFPVPAASRAAAPAHLIPLSTRSTQPSRPSSRVTLGDRIPSGSTRPRLASRRAPRAEATASQSAGPATRPSRQRCQGRLSPAGRLGAGRPRCPLPSFSHGAAPKPSSLSRTRSPCRCQARGTSRSSSSDQLSPSSRRSWSRSSRAGGRRRAAREGAGSCGKNAGLRAHRAPTAGPGAEVCPYLEADQAAGQLPGQPQPAQLLLQHGQGHAAPGHLLQPVPPVQQPLRFQALPAGKAPAPQAPRAPPRPGCGAGPPSSKPPSPRPCPQPRSANLRRWANRGSVASAGTEASAASILLGPGDAGPEGTGYPGAEGGRPGRLHP